MDDFLARIRPILNQPIRTYQFIDKGWTNIVVIVNDEWVVRFIRDPVSRQFAVERDFLLQFAPTSRIAVPNVIQHGDDFMVYPLLFGQRLDVEKVQGFSAENITTLQMQLGQFLTDLHAFDYSHSQIVAAPYGGGDFWGDLWPLAAPFLTKQTRQKAQQFFTSVDALVDFEAVEQVVAHSDLGTNNLLVDYSAEKLSGIIDFSDLAWGDPAIDFAGFYRHFGRAFVEGIVAFYGRDVGENFWVRVRYHAIRKTFFVHYFALNFGHEATAPNLIAAIERWFD